MNEITFLPPTHDNTSYFCASTREWRVSPYVFGYIQDRCRIEPQWAEREILCYITPGEVKIIVML